MKFLSETKAMARLRDVRDEFGARMRNSFEHKAKPCSVCEKPGSCCLDEHFVNVRITRLEAAAIRKSLDELGDDVRRNADARIGDAIEKYGLGRACGEEERTYACPLFERGIGCLVHSTAKPLPCIAHACYENREDLPPEELLAEAESAVAALNERVYGKTPLLQPIPIAIALEDRSAP